MMVSSPSGRYNPLLGEYAVRSFSWRSRLGAPGVISLRVKVMCSSSQPKLSLKVVLVWLMVCLFCVGVAWLLVLVYLTFW